LIAGCHFLACASFLPSSKSRFASGVADACLKIDSENGAGASSSRFASASARDLRAGSASGRAAKRRYSPIASSYCPASV